MPRWSITTNLAVKGPNAQPDEVEAEYFKRTEDGRFVEFKDADHKVVYMVSADLLVSVTRK